MLSVRETACLITALGPYRRTFSVSPTGVVRLLGNTKAPSALRFLIEAEASLQSAGLTTHRDGWAIYTHGEPTNTPSIEAIGVLLHEHLCTTVCGIRAQGYSPTPAEPTLLLRASDADTVRLAGGIALGWLMTHFRELEPVGALRVFWDLEWRGEIECRRCALPCLEDEREPEVAA